MLFVTWLFSVSYAGRGRSGLVLWDAFYVWTIRSAFFAGRAQFGGAALHLDGALYFGGVSVFRQPGLHGAECCI